MSTSATTQEGTAFSTPGRERSGPSVRLNCRGSATREAVRLVGAGIFQDEDTMAGQNCSHMPVTEAEAEELAFSRHRAIALKNRNDAGVQMDLGSNEQGKRQGEATAKKRVGIPA